MISRLWVNKWNVRQVVVLIVYKTNWKADRKAKNGKFNAKYFC